MIDSASLGMRGTTEWGDWSIRLGPCIVVPDQLVLFWSIGSVSKPREHSRVRTTRSHLCLSLYVASFCIKKQVQLHAHDAHHDASSPFPSDNGNKSRTKSMCWKFNRINKYHLRPLSPPLHQLVLDQIPSNLRPVRAACLSTAASESGRRVHSKEPVVPPTTVKRKTFHRVLLGLGPYVTMESAEQPRRTRTTERLTI
jgi:hypothetical protein